MKWFLITKNDTRIDLPACSSDWKPSAFWVTACLHDPEEPICRAHQTFFAVERKPLVANISDPHSEVRTTVQPCQIHNVHRPTPHTNMVHHVWPLSEGGPDVADNKIVVCGTGHLSIHDLLQHYKIMMGNVPWEIIKGYTQEERALAELGWKRLSRREM